MPRIPRAEILTPNFSLASIVLSIPGAGARTEAYSHLILKKWNQIALRLYQDPRRSSDSSLLHKLGSVRQDLGSHRKSVNGCKELFESDEWQNYSFSTHRKQGQPDTCIVWSVSACTATKVAFLDK